MDEVREMAFDYKKEFKEFYLPKQKPEIVTVPKMKYITVKGKGNPNEEGGEYKQAIELLYGVAYTLKMSPKQNYHMESYFDYVVCPLEGLWWGEGLINKDNFNWISMIRVPDFVNEKDIEWAKVCATKKKKKDFSKVEFKIIDEGVCVQCMHRGSYDDEPATIESMHGYIHTLSYQIDINEQRLHHEIYLSDPRKTQVEKMKTVIRLPIKKIDE